MCKRWAIVRHNVSTIAPCLHVLRVEFTIGPFFARGATLRGGLLHNLASAYSVRGTDIEIKCLAIITTISQVFGSHNWTFSARTQLRKQRQAVGVNKHVAPVLEQLLCIIERPSAQPVRGVHVADQFEFNTRSERDCRDVGGCTLTPVACDPC